MIQKINDAVTDATEKNEHLQKRKSDLKEVIAIKQESWKELIGFKKVIHDKSEVNSAHNHSEAEMLRDECKKIKK